MTIITSWRCIIVVGSRGGVFPLPGMHGHVVCEEVIGMRNIFPFIPKISMVRP